MQYNLYGYCSANPVLYTDPSGHKIIYSINNDVGVSDYINKYKLNQNSFNCYSYSIGKCYKSYNPGELSGHSINFGDSVNKVATAAKKDINKIMAHKCIDVTNKGGANYNIPSHSWLIAVRVGVKGGEYDYHFMKKSKNGPWSFKAGQSGPVIELKNNKTPSQVSWDIYIKHNKKYKVYYKGFYNSKIIYILVND